MNYIILVEMIEALEKLSKQAFDYSKLTSRYRVFKASCKP